MVTRDRSMLEHARSYAATGWHIFPLATKGDIKAPHAMTSEGREKKQGGHNAGTTDRKAIEQWWKRSPESGIGVHCERSGLVLVDVDPRKGGDKTLARLRKQHPGVFESTVEAQTGGGGLHLFFMAEPGNRYPGTLGDGIDVKHNGFVVLAPSPHPSGKHYAWTPGKSPEDGDAFMPRLSSDLCFKIKGERGKQKSLPPRGSSNDLITEAEEDDVFAEMGSDRVIGLTEEQIRKIVFDVPNSGHFLGLDHDDYHREGARYYDHWLDVLFGIYHETDGSEEGKQIAYEWSVQAAMHTDEKFEKSWDSAKVDNDAMDPKTFRTVIMMSNKATKEEREAEYESIRTMLIEAATLAEVTAAVQSAKGLALTDKLQRTDLSAVYRTAVKRITGSASITLHQAQKDLAYQDPELTNVPEWCRTICFIASENRFLDYRDPRRAWDKQAFDNTFMRQAMTEEDIRSGLSRSTHAPSDLALTRYGVKTVDARGYMPWDKAWKQNPFYEMDGQTYVNTYHNRFAAKMPKELGFEDEAAIDTFKTYLSTVFPYDGQMIVSWLRYPMSTGRRVGWSPLFYSIEGIGKTLLFNLVAAMVGRNNVSVITGMNLHEKFNGWAEGKLFAFVEEVGGFDRKERFDTLNALKPIITNDYISVRRMNRESFEVPNTVNVMLTTNKVNAFDLAQDGGDTRLWLPTPGFRSVAELEAFKKANPDFYTEVVDAFSNHAGAIKKWILSQPYHSAFKPGGRAPASAMKQEVIEASKSEEQLLIDDAIKSGKRVDVSGDLLRVDALLDLCGEIDPGVALPADRWLATLLQGMGFTRLGRVRVGGRKEPKRVFWSRNPAAFRKGDMTARINEWIEKESEL